MPDQPPLHNQQLPNGTQDRGILGEVSVGKSLPGAAPKEPLLASGGSAAPQITAPEEELLPTPPVPTPKRKLTPEEIQDIRDNRPFAVISYMYVLSIVALLAKPKSKFVQFHARQGVIIFILAVLFMFTPAFIMVPVELLLFLAIVVGVFQASNGFYYKLPFIYLLVIGKKPDSEIPPFSVPFKELFSAVRKTTGETKSQSVQGDKKDNSAL
jgi:uncharacterized membrane protein